MEHTDFYALTRRIKQIEYNELRDAIVAHGGSYEWNMEAGDYPIIAVNVDSICPNPMDINVTKVYVKNDNVFIEGEGKEYGEHVDFSCEDVFTGHLSYILDLLPETDKIKSVKTRHTTNILFGSDASAAYLSGCFKEFVESGEGYSHIVREFNTLEEKQAYLVGLCDADGWQEYAELTNEELLDDPNISYE